MRRLRLKAACWVVVWLILLCLAGCGLREGAGLEPAAVQASSLEPEAALASLETDPAEALHAKELIEEHLEVSDRYRQAFAALLEEHRIELEQISARMLQLNKIYYNRDYDTCVYPGKKDSELTAQLDAIHASLDALSGPETFMEAYPDVAHIVAADICQYKTELVDSHGQYFCFVSLNYTPEEMPEEQPYFDVEWLDAHWFFYVGWHE